MAWPPFGIFFYFFVPREAVGTDDFDLAFGFTELETAGHSSCRRRCRPAWRGVQPSTSDCNAAYRGHSARPRGHRRISLCACDVSLEAIALAAPASATSARPEQRRLKHSS
jgi:hypothetical protein